MKDLVSFLNWVVASWGGPGLVIVGLLYALRVLWKDNKDLRARNDRWTDRYMVKAGMSDDKQGGQV